MPGTFSILLTWDAISKRWIFLIETNRKLFSTERTPKLGQQLERDVIVVGGGAVSATRFTDDSHRTVLLLEAGPIY